MRILQGRRVARDGRHPLRRAACLAAAVLIAGTAGAADALADARVGAQNGSIVVSVIAVNGPDGAHAIVVEPFVDGSRDGWRVRQQRDGQPPFSSIDGDCTVNPFFNDVVCRGGRSTTAITMGDGADEVLLNASQPGGPPNVRCVERGVDRNNRPVPEGTASASLGAGADRFRYADNSPCPAGTKTAGTIFMRVDVRGGGGADDLAGTIHADRLRGEADGDLLTGEGGDDVLEGGPGDDTLLGGAGDELFVAEPGSDVFDGGPGTDRVSYAALTVAVTADLADADGPDGPAGEGDRILPSVENLIGGSAADTLRGSESANVLDGGAGDDALLGRGGDDVLTGGPGRDLMAGDEGNDTLRPGDGSRILSGGPGFDTLSWTSEAGPVILDLAANSGGLQGQPAAAVAEVEQVFGSRGADRITGGDPAETLNGGLGNDVIEGGAGQNTVLGSLGNDQLSAVSTIRDTFDGGPGNDTIVTRFGGLSDVVVCGTGTDRVELDLFDNDPAADCETVERFALDDGPPARVRRGRALRAGKRAALRVVCPKKAKVTCDGRLTLRTGRRPSAGKVLARSGYRAATGGRDKVRVRLPRRGTRRVVAVVQEPGASERGPRMSWVVLRVRRR